MSKAKKHPKETADIDQPTPVMSGREAEHYREIRSLESTCDRLEGEYEAARSSASAAKSLWSEAVSRLRECIRRGPDPQLALPLAGDFMSTDIREVLKLTEKQAEALAECGIYTVQDFEDVRAGNVPDVQGITDVPGVGQATADKWEDQILDWIAKQAKTTTSVVDDQEDDDEGGDE